MDVFWRIVLCISGFGDFEICEFVGGLVNDVVIVGGIFIVVVDMYVLSKFWLWFFGSWGKWVMLWFGMWRGVCGLVLLFWLLFVLRLVVRELVLLLF